MKFVDLLRQYQTDLAQLNLSRDQQWAIHQLLVCRKIEGGQLDYQCQDCHEHQLIKHSCGHRFCPQCGHANNQQWLNRQQQKLLPVNYFMVTFTLPSQLRGLAMHHSKMIYSMLMKCAVETLQSFARNDKKLGGKLGIMAVLHTHSRQLIYHPHVHLMVPAGSLSTRKQWQKKNSKYLFKEQNLATVFRAKFLTALKEKGFSVKETLPKHWISHCKKVGKGAPALKYLARYLYRGVVNERNLLWLNNGQLTWQYKDSTSKKMVKKTESVIQFLLKVLRHVLPKGFHRVRDYGLLHGANKLILKQLQLMLQITLPDLLEVKPIEIFCQCCGQLMKFCGFIKQQYRTSI